MQKLLRICEVTGAAGSPFGRVIAEARDGSKMTVELPAAQLNGVKAGCLMVADINIHPGWAVGDTQQWLEQFLRGQRR